MKEYTAKKIRNLVIIGHASVGKTTLAEAMLFSAGEINRQGTTDDGSTTSDYNGDEIDRKNSISASLLHCGWNNHKLNILDTPGYSDFIGEVRGAARVSDIGLVTLNAIAGVEVGTESATKIVTDNGNSLIFFVNRMDKEHADFDKCLAAVKNRYGNKGVQIHIPLNAGEGFDTFIDLISMTLVKYEANGEGKYSTSAIPAEHVDMAAAAREKLVEMAAESDDELLEKFFEEGSLTDEELQVGLCKGLKNGGLYPILCGAAEPNIGVRHLMDFLVKFGNSPESRSAEKVKRAGKETQIQCDSNGPLALLIFKTVSESHLGDMSFFRVFSGKVVSGVDTQNTSRNIHEKVGQLYVINGKHRKEVAAVFAGDICATVKLKDTHTGNTLSDKKEQIQLAEIDFPPPVIRVAVEPKSKGDEDKISTGLHTLHEQDPTFLVHFDSELHQTIISGQGELHLAIVVKRLKERFGVDVELVEPKIPYRETIQGRSETQGKYKKQSGGRGQYGDVWIKVEPQPSGDGFEFVNQIVGGAIPGKFIPAVEKGVQEAMEEGVLAGYKIEDVKVTLYDGSYHNVDSSEMAFKVAGNMAFKKAFMEAKPVLLEPVYDVEIVVPEEYMGDVMGDISGRRGKISGMESEGLFQIVKAKVPLSELYKYSTTLRSLSHGRGIHRRKFSHYETVPGDVTRKLVADTEAKREK